MKIVITGGAGHIASLYRAHAAGTHELRLLDIRPAAGAAPEATIVGSLADPAVARAACQGMDAVIHLAADPNPNATFESLVVNNYSATYQVFNAAHEAGCRRVIFASSGHTVSGLPNERRDISEDEECPGNLYGVSKRYGESLARYFAAVQGLSIICLRFGWVAPGISRLRSNQGWDWTAYLSARDLCQLLDKALASEVHFAVLNASSANQSNRFDLSRTRAVLGYAPQDRVEDVR